MLAFLTAAILTADIPPEISKWEPDIAALEQRDETELIPDDAILFYGSSSIRRWDTLAEDMTPWPVIQRGYGGARFSDAAYYASRVVGPHAGRVRGVVIFLANDIKGGNDALDVSPSVVAERAETLIANVRLHDEDVPLFIVEVTPTESRWGAWQEISEAGRLIRNVVAADSNAHFVPTAGAFLGEDGLPRSELFVNDQLHLNEAGYDLWSSLIKAALHEQLGAAKPFLKSDWEKKVGKWQADIKAFKKLDKTAPDNALLFYGSSSIRLWTTMTEDLAPWPVIQRGYGGAGLRDAAYFAPRVLGPHDPKAIVLFIGNDIYTEGRNPSDAARDFAKLLGYVRREKGSTPVIWIEVRPVLSKHHKWPDVQRLNQQIRTICDRDPNAHTLAFHDKFLSDDGVPIPELFAPDHVHLNNAGYAIWTNEIKRGLQRILTDP